jgi:pyruvate,water dikinase
MPLVLDLADARATLEAAGGKGMSLTKMVAAGLPVPPGFHVTTVAYRQFVAANGLQAQIEGALAGLDAADPVALEAAASRIAGAFAAGAIPPAIAEAVTAAYGALDARPRAGWTGDAPAHPRAALPVAVRSSATAEDLPGASFAGQQDTYLNISGAQAVLQAVQRCWASLWTARAIAYRLNQGIDQGGVALAVVVQELVPADAAGILFTANPVSGQRDELVVNAAWGLGEAVVSSAVTPDTITVAKATGKVLKRETAQKLVMTVRDAQGSMEAHVPTAQQRQPVLDDRQAAALAELGRRIEALYGMPMDVEWTLAGGQFAVVQARPITALPPEWMRPDPRAMYARSSLAEHTPNPATPLFGTLGLELANMATERMWERLLGGSAEHVRPDGGMYRTLNGYVFLGVRMNVTDLTMLRVMMMSFAQIPVIMRGSVLRWQAALAEFRAVVEEWEGRPIAPMTPAELLAGVRAVFGAACRYFTNIQTTLPVAATAEVSFTKFYDSLVRGQEDPPATTFLVGLDTQALAAEKALYDLAAWVGADDDLAAYVQATPSEQLAAELQAQPAQTPTGSDSHLWAEWSQRFARYLDTYGRAAYEFDFAQPTVQETPGPLLDTIKAYLAGASESPYARQRSQREKRAAATQAVLRRLDPVRQELFTRLLRWAQATGPMREDSIAAMGLGHPRVRRMLGELGRRFAAAGAIAQAGDIYWLEGAEVEQLIARLEGAGAAVGARLAAGEALPVLPDLSGRIAPRQERWRAELKITPPIMIPEKTFWSRFVEGGDAEQHGGKVVLKGAGTSAGRVTAPARTLFGPEDFATFQQGDVLVAVTTTPAWTPLFALAAAVVTDIGGPLSHSSIVAREYGIPAVMAARTATRIIRSGQLITVDGSAGTVTLE